MLELMKKLLGKSGQVSAESNAIQDANVALCALLLEAAYVDGHCSVDEKQHVIETLTKECGISRENIDAFIAQSDSERQDSVDIFRFTRYLNNNLTKEEKIEVMEAVWRIIHIDGQLEMHEDHFAHKLANLLRLTHSELIDAKIKARQQLSES